MFITEAAAHRGKSKQNFTFSWQRSLTASRKLDDWFSERYFAWRSISAKGVSTSMHFRLISVSLSSRNFFFQSLLPKATAPKSFRFSLSINRQILGRRWRAKHTSKEREPKEQSVCSVAEIPSAKMFFNPLSRPNGSAHHVFSQHNHTVKESAFVIYDLPNKSIVVNRVQSVLWRCI